MRGVLPIGMILYLIAISIGYPFFFLLKKKGKLTWSVYFLISFVVAIIPTLSFTIATGFNPLVALTAFIVALSTTPVVYSRAIARLSPEKILLSSKSKKSEEPGEVMSEAAEAGSIPVSNLPWEKGSDNENIIRSCSSLIDNNPKDDMAYFYRGKAKYEEGIFEEAKQDIYRAIEIAPEIRTYKEFYIKHFKRK